MLRQERETYKTARARSLRVGETPARYALREDCCLYGNHHRIATGGEDSIRPRQGKGIFEPHHRPLCPRRKHAREVCGGRVHQPDRTGRIEELRHVRETEK